jgi:hypothetical protein
VERHEPALEAQIAEVREVAELLRRQLEGVRADRDASRRKLASGCCPSTRVQDRRTASRGGAGTCPIRRQRAFNRADGNVPPRDHK